MTEKILRGILMVLGLILVLRFAVPGLVLGPGWFDAGVGSTPFLASEYRFFSAMMLALGVVLFWIARDPDRHGVLLTILMTGALLGAVARIVSIVQYGLPGRPAVVALVIEVAAPLAVLVLIRLRRIGASAG